MSLTSPPVPPPAPGLRRPDRRPGLDKVVASAAEAVADVPDGASLAVGGFGLCGNPVALIEALLAQGTRDLWVVSNNCGVDDWGLGLLLRAGRIRRMTSSYVGENKEFERQFLSGELELELTPQGTLAEKLRAGGSGIAGFWTRTGVGTQVAEGGLPQRYDGAGGVARASSPKEVRAFGVGPRGLDGTFADEAEFVLEEAITTDFALVHAQRGDRHGNLAFHRSARNFSPLAAMAGRVCVAQVEELVEPGEIDPDAVHLPGVFVHRVVEVGTDAPKRIERRTVRPAAETGRPAPAASGTAPAVPTPKEG
jgi:3-oxoacid CoA-transferase subunit A